MLYFRLLSSIHPNSLRCHPDRYSIDMSDRGFSVKDILYLRHEMLYLCKLSLFMSIVTNLSMPFVGFGFALQFLALNYFKISLVNRLTCYEYNIYISLSTSSQSLNPERTLLIYLKDIFLLMRRL